MRLRRFSVSGYKNLTQPVVLDGLGPIDLIHGANNVGKSNLLQAIDVFFRSLPAASDVPSSQGREVLSLGIDLFGADPRSLFNLERLAPILLRGVLDVPVEELAEAGIQDPAGTEIDVEMRLSWDAVAGGAFVKINRFRFADGRDIAQERSNDDTARALFFAKFLSKNLMVREGPAQRFAILGVHRGLEETLISPRQGEPAPLSVEMYDCRESQDRVRRDRWRAFVRAMEQFQDVTGDGAFEVTFPRTETQARLVLDTDKMRIPLLLLGSGVQQVAALLGNLLVRNASIVAIEEPELNLRWDLQDRLRQALETLVAAPQGAGGLDQLFLTSHSPAFETGDSFWLMEAKDGVPVVSRRPTSELPLVLGAAPRHLGLPESTAQAYVTSQGVVKLPEDVAARLGVPHGGGVVFVDAEPRGVRVLSNEQYLDELGLTDGVPPRMGHPEALIRAGAATLAFDTNALLGFSREDRRVVFGAFLTVCDDANRLRSHGAAPLPIAIVVPALARMEGLHDLRAQLGGRFDARRVVVDLRRKNAAVASFDEDTAVKASSALHTWFPSDEAWDAAKRERCLEVLGLLDAPSRGGLASIDWAIAAQAEAERWILVTGDTRAEFRRVTLKVTKGALRRILDELLQERGLC